MTTRAIDALDELAELIADCPILAREMPLHWLAARYRCSAKAIDLAEQLETPENGVKAA